MENLDKIFEIRRENLRRKIREAGGPGSLTMQLNLSNPSYLSHLAGPTPSRVITEKTARKVEALLGLPQYWLDTDQATVVKDPTGNVVFDRTAPTLRRNIERPSAAEIASSRATAAAIERMEMIKADAIAAGQNSPTILISQDKNGGKSQVSPTTETTFNADRLEMCLTILSAYKLTPKQQAKIASLMYSCDKPDSELGALAKSLADLVASV